MKLSMAILREYLEKYQPVAIINSDKPTIIGVKLFSYEKQPDPDYLYVGHNNDFFYGSESREVLLVHRKDVMSLSTSELEDVFNEIIECFAFYSSWEQKLLAAYDRPNPEQAIIDACEGVIGPMFFSTMSLQVTALSRQYPKGSINRNWDDFLESGTLSFERFSDMKTGSYVASHNSIWDGHIFYESRVERYPYSAMISQVSMNGKLTGQLTIISESPFETWQQHLFPPIRNALCLAANSLIDGDRGSVAQSVFLDLVRGSRNEVTRRKFYDLMGWNLQQSCVIAVLKNRNAGRVSFGYDVDLLRKEYSQALFCINEDTDPEREIICCLPVNDPVKEGFDRKFQEFAKSLGLECGISYLFEGIEAFVEQYQQAERALHSETGCFYSCAMYELVNPEGSSAYRWASIHPALFQLLEYDKRKHTDFYHMLETYLHNERDRVKTASDLYIHKNTLVYRLKKMEELFALHLDDPYDREYLLISFACMRSKQNR